MSHLVQTYLLDAITAEKAFAERLLAFSREGDDEEVQLAFADHARESHIQAERLESRFALLGGEDSGYRNIASRFSSVSAAPSEFSHTPEEKLVQNLITAYTIETGECAMYEALAVAAQAAGDAETEALARDIQAAEHRTAEKIFHFLPSRSKIAFNVLTAGELDPAVETKVGML